jgi:hypothetical protein
MYTKYQRARFVAPPGVAVPVEALKAFSTVSIRTMDSGKPAPTLMREETVLGSCQPAEVFHSVVIPHRVDVVAAMVQRRTRTYVGEQDEMMDEAGITTSILIQRHSEIPIRIVPSIERAVWTGAFRSSHATDFTSVGDFVAWIGGDLFPDNLDVSSNIVVVHNAGGP